MKRKAECEEVLRPEEQIRNGGNRNMGQLRRIRDAQGVAVFMNGPDTRRTQNIWCGTRSICTAHECHSDRDKTKRYKQRSENTDAQEGPEVPVTSFGKSRVYP
ncbi:Protein U4, partial [Clarias magur]